MSANSSNNGWVYDYLLKEHLGNTRMMITDDYNVASPILEANNYYPFGLLKKGISTEASNNMANQNIFFGKEIQEKNSQMDMALIGMTTVRENTINR